MINQSILQIHLEMSIKDGSTNRGSYQAKIFDSQSIELNQIPSGI